MIEGPSQGKFFRKSGVDWPVVLVLTGPFLFFILQLLQGKALFWGTPVMQFVPWRTLAYDQLTAGFLPLWNPLNGMGAPLIANYQSALFYPPGFLLFLFYLLGDAPGVAWGFTLLVPIHLAWAGLGMVQLLRLLGIDKRGQVTAGLAFGMGGYFLARAGFYSMVWAGAWLPWLIWVIEKSIVQRSGGQWMKPFPQMILILTMQFLAGHAQLMWYSIVYAGFYALLRNGFALTIRKRFLILTRYAVALGISVGLALIQLAPTFEYLRQSQRSAAVNYELAMTYSFWPWHLLTFFFPDLFGNPGAGDYWGYGAHWEDAVYIGVIPILFALTSLRLLFYRLRTNEQVGKLPVRFLWGMVFVSIILALGRNTPVFPWLYEHVLTFDMFQGPARYMIWAVFSLALLAGIGADRWKRPVGKSRKAWGLAVVVGLAFIIGAISAHFFLPEIQASMIRAFLAFGVFLGIAAMLALRTPLSGQEIRETRWKAAGVSILLIDLYLAGALLNPFIPAEFYKRAAGSSGVESNYWERSYISQKDEYRLKFEHFFRFDSYREDQPWSTLRHALIPNINILDGFSYVNNFDPLVPDRYATFTAALETLPTQVRDRILLDLGVDRIQSVDEAGSVRFSTLQKQDNGDLRYYLCSDPAVSGDQALQKLVQAGTTSKAMKCIIVEPDEACVVPTAGDVSVEITTEVMQPTRVEILVQTTSPVWIRIPQMWYPGWVAKIGGLEAEVHKADFIFVAVCVPGGSHAVTLEYRPAVFLWGAALSMIGWLLFFSVSMWSVTHRKKETSIREPGIENKE